MFMVADCLLSTKLDTADQHTSPQATPAANRQRFYVSRNMLFKTLIKKSAKSPERLLIIRIIFVSPPAWWSCLQWAGGCVYVAGGGCRLIAHAAGLLAFNKTNHDPASCYLSALNAAPRLAPAGRDTNV